MSPTVSEPARWELRWPEVAVLDGNAAALGIEEASLMDSAGKSLAATALEMTDGAVLVLCGPGNNGGDGFVAARYLREWGVEVSVLASHASARTDVCVWPERPSGEWALVVDCLLGAGASGPGYSLRGQIKDIAAWAAGLGLPVLACDIPTGLGGPDALQADATITFHSMKQGLGSPDSGDITVVPLPWPAEVEDCGPGDATRYPTLDASARKGDRGRLWVIGGGPYHGAPLLAGMAAARSGCDLVHVAMPSVAAGRAEWPTTLIPEELPDEDKLTGSSLEHIAIAFEARPPQALVIGPGLGRDEATMQAVSALLDQVSQKGIPAVIDADAINAMPEGAWPTGLQGVATPHAKEAERWLAGASPAEALADCTGESATIVVTGPEDTLTGPEGRFCRATGGHSRMAVGGTGDLLAGTIGGLLAQGMSAWPAARLGCALLREAGTRAAEKTGPGLLAEDVPVEIARVLAEWT
ncbi:MAG TPA: NAD(P)H-hydrate dehydratase [Candidatus Poseidoniales archaeon]|nr:NAD(P)H-hydrate dehydratase [Candidatus Poseidoniales archaeon]